MKCDECGVRFDFPAYVIPVLANWDVDELGKPATKRDGSKNMLIPVCPNCFRFTGYKQILNIPKNLINLPSIRKS